MRATVIRHEDHDEAPWKNGLGGTREVTNAYRDDGTLVWRISQTSVDSNGVFSNFAGCKRIIMVLKCPGMTLDFGVHGHATLERPFDPVTFDGGWTTHVTLLGGPLTDFNVMTAQDMVTAKVNVLRGGEGSLDLVHTECVIFFHVLEGACDATGYSLDTTLVAGETLRADSEAWQGHAVDQAPDTTIYRTAIRSGLQKEQ
ncbi:MAG: hypothetical protein CMM46_14180 [Rhodospirillaceae bacterium]|nr:hypothetical protein [Rhodospirillaceae bacterium]|tara:strand:- start:3627 stop:4226 length:600 start_codon:yes stop_codon:yes gene_type:complete